MVFKFFEGGYEDRFWLEGDEIDQPQERQLSP
jgi:hypothetical protein